MKNRQISLSNDYKLMIIDDDASLIDSVSSFLVRNGYDIRGIINPVDGLEVLRNEKYNLLILDYFMSPIKGDDFVSRLRQFDRDLYVILLTGHKDLAPPLATIRALDIQAYCEKSHRLDQLLLLIESGTKSISQMGRITNYRDSLNHILSVLPAINQYKPLEDKLQSVLTQITALTQRGDAYALIDGFGEAERVIYKGVGIYDMPLEKLPETQKATLMEEASRAKAGRGARWTDNGVTFPIIGIDNLYEGVIHIAGKIEDDSRYLLEIFIVQVAVVIQNTFLHDKLAIAYSNLKSSYVETIEALRLAVDAKDIYTRGHSDRVSMYTQLIGAKLGMSQDKLEDLRIGGLFHDIGKIGIGDDILLKNTKLTDQEFMQIKEHPTKGALILSAISSFERIRHIVSSHHERIDGKGYPSGLNGDQIPLDAKIVCVADAFDAMTSDRHYRSKFTRSAAVEQLKLHSGTQFDNDIAECFIAIIEDDSEEIRAIYGYE